MGIEARRSDRLMLTVPLVMWGTGPNGIEFKDDAETISLNRHGARIQISRPLVIGQTVRVVNRLNVREAEFRIIGPVTPPTDNRGEWGMEYLDPNDNIWGIQFPPSPAEEDKPKALLECRRCHEVALMRISMVEVEVLGTSGIVTKLCHKCEAVTPWGYAEGMVARSALSASSAGEKEPEGAERRCHRRLALQLPTLLRDYFGGAEVAKSENVSKGGVCFTHEKNYLVGEGLLVACPYTSAEKSITVPGRIVRRKSVSGTHKKVYGVRYEGLKS